MKNINNVLHIYGKNIVMHLSPFHVLSVRPSVRLV